MGHPIRYIYKQNEALKHPLLLVVVLMRHEKNSVLI